MRSRQKSCQLCEQPKPVLYRVKYDESAQWSFVCRHCWDSISQNNPLYASIVYVVPLRVTLRSICKRFTDTSSLSICKPFTDSSLLNLDLWWYMESPEIVQRF
ncbi:MAG: hypothetical protein KME05_20775 [Gloeocapsa sp. UFS-A4-WI-NPMV-4B04]|nr:hypothetical protein [Gloeocapsa sp. UFS-A4-WI-NPMV-4B04]